MESARNRRNRGQGHLEAEYNDFSSSCPQSRQHAFDSTLHRFSVTMPSHPMGSIAQTNQLGPGAGSLASIGIGEDSIFGEAAEDLCHWQGDGGVEPVPNSTMHPDLEMVFDSILQSNSPRQLGLRNQDMHYQTTVNDSGRFTNDLDFLPQAVSDPPSQPAPEQQNGNYQSTTNRSLLSDFGQESPPDQQYGNYQRIINGPFLGPDRLSQEMSLSEEEFPTSSQETGLSWNNFKTSMSIPSARPETIFSSSEFDCLGNFPTSSQESSSSHLTTSASPTTPATTPSSVNTSPDRLSCPECFKTFGRAGDLKRHQGMHLPRKYHCRQQGCKRNGGKGFYRRDKLRAHQKKRHGMHL